MKHTFAAFLAAAFAAGAHAQQPPVTSTPVVPPQPPPVVVPLNPNTGSQFMPIGPPPPLPPLNVILPGPVPTPGPPVPLGGPGFYKSGGVQVGLNGAYPYDSGWYLLAGMDGLTRVSGTFTMVPAGPNPWGCGAGAGGNCGAPGSGFVAGKCRSCSFLHPFKK